jgi:hypothetical protein
MALEGVGIAVINDHFALPYLKRRELVQVLSDWQMPPVSAWAVVSGSPPDAGANTSIPRRARGKVRGARMSRHRRRREASQGAGAAGGRPQPRERAGGRYGGSISPATWLSKGPLKLVGPNPN